MALVRCPSCEAVLTSADWSAGRCSNCRRTLESSCGIVEWPRVLPSMTYTEPSSSSDLLSWHAARAGLAFIGYGVSVGLIAYGLRRALTILNSDRFEWRPDGMALALDRFLAVVLAAAVTVAVVGTCLCYTVPASRRSKGWITAVLVCQVLAVVALFALNILLAQVDVVLGFDRRFRMPAGDIGVSLKANPFVLCSLVFLVLLCKALFCAFLLSLTRFLRADRLRAAIKIHFAVSTFLDIIFFAVFVIYARYRPLHFYRDMAELAWIRMGVYAALSAWFITLVFLAREAITNRLPDIRAQE
jgi:hypothetical protein